MSTAKQLNEVIALLVARFPNTFAMFQERRKPLKLGIHHDLAAALGEVEHLNAALAYYTRSIGYLKAQKAGAKRIDLEGNEAGSVSEEQALNAQKALARIHARQKQKVAAEPEAKPPARDGLAALREAAKRRRTVA